MRHKRDPLVQPTTKTKAMPNVELKNVVVAATSEDKAVDISREIPMLLAIPRKMAPTLTMRTLRSLRELTEETTEEPIEATSLENSSSVMDTREVAEVETTVVEATTNAEAVEVKAGKPPAPSRKNSILIKKLSSLTLIRWPSLRSTALMPNKTSRSLTKTR